MSYRSETETPFPASPVPATDKLVPITSWADMHREAREMGVELDLFWYDSVAEGVAYFFHWLPEPRCIVLVVWNGTEPTHVESRKRGDVLASDDENGSILGEVIHAFRFAGYWPELSNH